MHLDPPLADSVLSLGKRRDFVAAVDLALRRVLALLHVEHEFPAVASRVKAAPWFRALEVTWEHLDPEYREGQWQQVVARLVEMSYASRPYCIRCGECCRAGSPSLHLEDLGLWSQGLVSPQDLYTVRRGEPVNLSVEGRLGSLGEELVKIRQRPKTGHCIFYREEDSGCSIYDHRPLQCRVQACWDPSSLEERWHDPKLSRRHLLQDNQERLELIEAHDERCSPEKLCAAVREWRDSGREAAVEQILDQLRYDTALRALVRDRLGLGEREQEFYFGRPLVLVVRAYGFKVDRDDEGTYHLFHDP